MPENMPVPPVGSEVTDKGIPAKEKLPVRAHFMCGWPLLLVAIGGCIGGGLGGAAYGINLSIYKSKLPVFAKVILNILTGLMAFGLWAIIVANLNTVLKK